MVPSKHLTRLSLQKQILLLRSAQLRFESVQAARELSKPVALAESAAKLVRRLSPVLAASSLLLPLPKVRRRLGVVATALKWAPQLFRFARTFSTPHP